MGWRQRQNHGYYAWYLGWYGFCWNTPGIGRFWKRQLSKSRRRTFKQGRGEHEDRTRYRGQSFYESECNYKCW